MPTEGSGPVPESRSPSYIELSRTTSLYNLFASLRKEPFPILLESSLKSNDLGRYSYFTAQPFLVITAKGRTVQVEQAGSIQQFNADPFTLLKEYLKRYRRRTLPGLPSFQGGAAGYWAYELSHHIERLPCRAVDDLGLPEMVVGFYDWVVAQDNLTGRIWAIAGESEGASGHAEVEERLAWLARQWEVAGCTQPRARQPVAGKLTSNFTYDRYIDAVRTIKEYIVQGDIYQANISQRFHVTVDCEPWELYARLRHVNQAPFGAYLGQQWGAVLSGSPEEFIHIQGNHVHSRPMKGTRPRGATPENDRKLAAELVASAKDRAENLMIVDLVRNDLGRVCVPGSIAVPDLFVIEEYPTVYQMVSTVEGILQPWAVPVDVLRACFPGGSVTGAPKVRAMELIDEIEPTQRSVYCGAIGYIGFDGSMLTSIPIRTLIAKGNEIYFQVGGGIVADSDPQAEFNETMHKAEGSLRTLGVVK